MDDFDARRASLDLVTAFVNNNKLTAGELPMLLSDVFKAISGFDAQADQAEASATVKVAPSKKAAAPVTTSAPAAPDSVQSSTPAKLPEKPAAPVPAVSVEASLADPSVVVSLITGEKFKMLKRHLKKHGLTEAEYKARFNLPDDYPMVAPEYAALRRDVATKMHAKGKGAQGAAKAEVALAAKPDETVAKPVVAKPAAKKAQPKSSAPAKAAPKKASLAKSAKTARGSRTPKASGAAAPAPANVPIKPAAETTKAPEASEPKGGLSVPDAVVSKAPAKKPAKQRRMARQPASAPKSGEAAAKPEQAKASNATPAVSSKPSAGKAGPASGGPAATGEVTTTKPTRKARKKLSAKFG